MKQQLVCEIVSAMRDRYQSASRKLKTQMLDEGCINFKRSRKGLIRLFNQDPGAPIKSRPGRPAEYDDTVIWWLQTLWLVMGHMNSKAMNQALPQWLPHHPDPDFPKEIKDKILKMSPSTMDRLLSSYKKNYFRKNRSGTRRGSKLPRIEIYKHMVPHRPFDQKVTTAGFMEADTVAHCGGSLSGEFVWTLNMTDHKTGWCEQRAVWHKESEGILSATCNMQSALPFTMWGLHSDCGSEFLNSIFVPYFNSPESQTVYTRGRAYKKNDQAHVEQKNYTHVRQLFGYERMDEKSLVEKMNDIYQNEHRLLMNFFVPQLKLIEKTRVGARYRKKYDTPKTPYQRILECNEISQAVKDSLTSIFAALNPFELKQRREEKMKFISKGLKKTLETPDGSSNQGQQEAA
jgi:hypothetical protein